jgi:DNA polymerase family B
MSFFEENFLTKQTAEFMPFVPPKKMLPIEDNFEVVYTVPERDFLTDAELQTLPPGSVMIFDSESYINYYLFAFKHQLSGKYLTFEYPCDVGKLAWVLKRFLIIGFNSRTYDMLMVSLALTEVKPKQLKDLSNKIINNVFLPYQFEQSHKIKIVAANTIDLIEVAPLVGSLKLYAGRLHCKRMQDLPIPEDAFLTPEQKTEIKNYCLTDLDNTELVFNFLKPQLELRYNLSNVYNVDLRSKSDAQIAETVLATEIKRLTGQEPRKPLNHTTYFSYEIPSYLNYHHQILQELLAILRTHIFHINEDGSIKMPELITRLDLRIAKSTYRIGAGGLHSSETSIAHKADEGMLLLDRDVSSYYPAIILNQELYPRHLGKAFLAVYKSIVNQRLEAKRTGDKITSDALKISINGTFGKLGNKWSLLYSPELLFQVTLSGQLCLLLLIDMIEKRGWGLHVVSANTDGVLIECHFRMRETLNQIIREWEQLTGFNTEETEYSAVYSRDVNNYIAIKKDGTIKVKGCYSEKGSAGDSPLSRNPEAFVCTDAVIAFVGVGTPVEETIYSCRDIRRFLVVRNVKGGAEKSKKYLGKVIRWYYSTECQGDIQYVLSGNKVPLSDGGKPLMELCDELPPDLDFEKYIAIANDMLIEIGARKPDAYKRGQLFTFYKK